MRQRDISQGKVMSNSEETMHMTFKLHLVSQLVVEEVIRVTLVI